MDSVTILPTFAGFLEGRSLPGAPDLSKHDRVTIAWLQYHQAVVQRVDEMKQDPVGGANLRALLDVLSEDIIDSHLGRGWFANHVDGSASSDQSKKYLSFDSPPGLRLLAVHRVHELARRLYQLQSFPWFSDIVRRVRTRDLSGAGFELDVALVLHSLVAAVTPKQESSQKGEDYDFHLQVYGLDVPVEAKAKDDDTPYSAKTVINTVKDAARQLPKGSKGIVFVRVPSAWVGPELEESYATVVTEGTRQTSRVGAVITAIDKMSLSREGTRGHVTRHHHFYKHASCPDELWKACLRLKEILERGLTFFAPPPPF